MSLNVKNQADETIGEIDDVIVNAEGTIQQVIVSVGGFLGIGERKVAIAWQDVKLDANRDVAMVNMTKDQLKVAPEFKDQRRVTRTDTTRTDTSTAQRPMTGSTTTGNTSTTTTTTPPAGTAPKTSP